MYNFSKFSFNLLNKNYKFFGNKLNENNNYNYIKIICKNFGVKFLPQKFNIVSNNFFLINFIRKQNLYFINLNSKKKKLKIFTNTIESKIYKNNFKNY